MERYRSGHNEAVLKTVCPQGRVGSNPTLSAYRELCLCRVLFVLTGSKLLVSLDAMQTLVKKGKTKRLLMCWPRYIQPNILAYPPVCRVGSPIRSHRCAVENLLCRWANILRSFDGYNTVSTLVFRRLEFRQIPLLSYVVNLCEKI